MKARFACLILIALTLLLALPQPGGARAAVPPASPTPATVAGITSLAASVYIPFVSKSLNCSTGETYGGFNPASRVADPPAALSGDLNLSLRSYQLTGNTLGIVDFGLGGNHDPKAPQLLSLLSNRTLSNLTMLHNYQVNKWLWPSEGGALPYGSRGSALTTPPVTLVGIQTTPGEKIYLPNSGYGPVAEIPAGTYYYALVLYATSSSITLKYTSEDNVVSGYTLHVENVCVDPALVTAYTAANNAGRQPLPALRLHQAFGVAQTTELKVSIRDTGNFMDPRSKQDWWVP